MVIAGVFALSIIWPALVVWRGYVLSLLWLWFVVPALDAPPLTIPVALGISTIVTMLTARHDLKTKDTDGWQAVFEHTIFAATLPAMSLFFGWIFTLFM